MEYCCKTITQTLRCALSALVFSSFRSFVLEVRRAPRVRGECLLIVAFFFLVVTFLVADDVNKRSRFHIRMTSVVN